jgi:acetyl-CoA acetyltransferase
MSKGKMGKIRELIRSRQYDLSAHAVEEMAEDDLDIADVEQAVINGRLARIEKDDPRGARYVIEGTGLDEATPVGVVGRFTGTGRFLVITVYEITDLEG